MGEPATSEVLNLEDLEAVSGLRTGRKHVLSILVENKPGVLARVAGLFSRRGFNITSLAVGPTEQEPISRTTIAGNVEGAGLGQVTKQVRKVVKLPQYVGVGAKQPVPA